MTTAIYWVPIVGQELRWVRRNVPEGALSQVWDTQTLASFPCVT